MSFENAWFFLHTYKSILKIARIGVFSADTHDKTVGKSVEIDFDNMEKFLLSIEDNTGLRLQTRLISGNELIEFFGFALL